MASYYKVVQQEIHTVWPAIEGWLHEALLGDLTIHTDDIKPLCISGLLELFLISDDERIAGFFIGRAMQNPRGKYYYAAWFWRRKRHVVVEMELRRAFASCKSRGMFATQYYRPPIVAKIVGHKA